MKTAEGALIPGRECGACTVCCQVPPIDDPALTKPSGVLCVNCISNACSIYERRPRSCRVYYCQWRYLSVLHEDWRPDRSGVLIDARPHIGADGKDSLAMVLMIFADHAVVFDEGFARLVAIWTDRGDEVILSLLVDDCSRGWEAALRPFVAEGVTAGSLQQVKTGIRAAYLDIMRRAQGMKGG
jgi:hypothetical protein